MSLFGDFFSFARVMSKCERIAILKDKSLFLWPIRSYLVQSRWTHKWIAKITNQVDLIVLSLGLRECNTHVLFDPSFSLHSLIIEALLNSCRRYKVWCFFFFFTFTICDAHMKNYFFFFNLILIFLFKIKLI